MTRQYSRRRVLLAGALTLSWTGCCTRVGRTAERDESSGCWIPPEQTERYLSNSGRASLFESGQESLEPRSGNAPLDKALAQALAKIARLFGVLPAFAYYDDEGSPNARATREARLDRADGTVLFGLALLNQLLSGNRPDAAIVAVCAHEFGHIASYKNGMIAELAPNRNDPFRAEQFADFMAGYFAGRRKRENPDFPAVAFATTQRRFGGGDHGSGRQRGEAVQQGFLVAYQQRLDADAAKAAALTFALSRSNEY
jgi:hypothetical protein